MNILTSNGLVERYVREWAGPAAVVRRIKVRLGAPNYPDDTMVLTGEVVSVRGQLVEVSVEGKNALGVHVHGTVTAEFPDVDA